jgi:aminomethyltransferase
MLGLLLEGRGVLRNHQQVFCGTAGEGEITSGSFSPTLKAAIGMARLPAEVKPGDRCEVEMRGKRIPARVVKYPFVRNGASCIDKS